MDKKISQLTALTGANAAADDQLAIVDTNVAETKKISRAEFFSSTPNIGVAVNPSAWGGSLDKALQIGNSVNIANGFSSSYYTNNAYYNGSNWIYQNSSVSAGLFTIENATGVFTWSTAPSGTAGNAVTFSERMRIDSSGRLAVGATSVTNGTAFGGSGQVNITKLASAGYPCLQISTTTGGGGSVQFTSAETVNGLIGYNAAGGTNQLVINNLLSGTLLFATNDTERMRIDSSGNLLVGTTTADGRLCVKTPTNTGSFDAINAKDGNNTVIFEVRDDGLITTSVTGAGPYNLTTATAANLVVTATGEFRRSTSSLKYKTDVQDATHGLNEVMALRSVTYKGNNDGDKIFGGLIAEEVHEAGLTEFVVYDNQNQPDALHYGNMVSLAFKAIQELKAELDTVKAELNQIKGA